MTTPRRDSLPDTVADAATVLEEAYEDRVRDQAAEHLDSSIETLAELSKGKNGDGDTVDTTPATRRGAANDLIGHGFARDAGGQPDAAGTGSGRGGIHIQIISFGDQPDVRVEHDITPEHKKITEGSEDADVERGDREEVHVSRAEGRPASEVRGDPQSREGTGTADRPSDARKPGAVSRAYTP